MRSATRPLAALALLLAAGCGSYANGIVDDIAYLNALPTAQDLRYSVPKDPGAPACALGESKSARDTFNLGTGLEAVVEGILKIIDFIRAQPPTARDSSSRTWGPWPDGQHVGVWDRVRMVRLADNHFSFVIEQSPSVDGAYLAVLSADLRGSQATRGAGTLSFDYGAAFRAGTGKDTDPKSGFLDIGYDAASDPRTIAIQNREVPQAVKFSVAAYADGQLQVQYDFVDADGAHLFGSSKFLKSGAGASKVTGEKTVGIVKYGDTISECWDALYCRSYLNDLANWSGPPCPAGPFCEVGSIASCPKLTGGLPFP